MCVSVCLSPSVRVRIHDNIRTHEDESIIPLSEALD